MNNFLIIRSKRGYYIDSLNIEQQNWIYNFCNKHSNYLVDKFQAKRKILGINFYLINFEGKRNAIKALEWIESVYILEKLI